MKKLLIALLFSAGLIAQTPVTVEPDCKVPMGTFTAVANGANFSNISLGCSYWEFSYTSVGFSAVSVVFQSAPNAAGDVPGVWVTFAGTTVSGTNPGTATTQGGANVSGYYPWLRVILASKTGTGTVRAYAYGWRPNPSSIATAGGVPAATVPFSGITASTNTTAAMVVGTGASIAATGSGSINATLLNGSSSYPVWTKYTVTAIADTVNGCANANGCWQVNGVLGAIKTAGLTQAVTLFQLPSNGYLTSFRIKTALVCIGTTTLLTGLGTASTPNLFMVSAGTGYDLTAAVSATNLSTSLPLVMGSDTTAAVNVVANLTSTVDNIDLIVAGCSFAVWTLTSTLP